MAGACPECGLPFSLTNPRTYLTSDQLGRTLPEGLTSRLLKVGGSLAMCWLFPAIMIQLIRITGGTGDWAIPMCCGYFLLWPTMMIASTVLMMDAMLPSQIAGVLANIAAASLTAGVLIFVQWALIFLITFGNELPSPILIAFGLAIGPVAGLWRAHQQT